MIWFTNLVHLDLRALPQSTKQLVSVYQVLTIFTFNQWSTTANNTNDISITLAMAISKVYSTFSFTLISQFFISKTQNNIIEFQINLTGK